MQSESLDLCKAAQFPTNFDYTCSIVEFTGLLWK